LAWQIGVAGVAGRMGRLVVEEARKAGLTVSFGILQPGEAPPEGVAVCENIAALAGSCDLVIDFTHASAAAAHAGALAQAGTAWVLGTTGLGAADEAAVAQAAQCIPVMYAPNYSPGVTLMLVLAERMAAALPAETYDAEILEMHHRQKVDAPSGTAIGLGQAVARGRGVAFEGVRSLAREGHTGARRYGDIGFAALRGGQVVGEHTLIFAAASEQLTLTHRAFDRASFAAGAVRAAIWLHGRPAGLYDMRDVLDLKRPG